MILCSCVLIVNVYIECIGSPSTIRHCALRASVHALDINIVHNHDNYSGLRLVLSNYGFLYVSTLDFESKFNSWQDLYFFIVQLVIFCIFYGGPERY